MIETVCIASLVFYMMFEMLGGETQLSEMISQVSVLAAAAARLLPSANRINNYTTSIAYLEPFLDNVSDNLQQEIHDKISHTARRIIKRRSRSKSFR